MKEKIKKLSELRQQADEYDYLGHHMEYLYKDDETGDYHLCLRSHDSPSYGYCEPEYENTPEWYDDWWSLFADINLTKGVVESHYGGPDYDGYKVIIDEEIDYTKVEE